MTALGRQIRLGTASMKADPGGAFINPARMDLRKYAQRSPIARVLCDYLLYHLRDPRRALDLASEATAASDHKDWWWKARLGKCYYQLGLLRDAERYFKSALNEQSMAITHLELVKVYIKLDQPKTALEMLARGLAVHPRSVDLNLAIGRIHDMLNASEPALLAYKTVLQVGCAGLVGRLSRCLLDNLGLVGRRVRFAGLLCGPVCVALFLLDVAGWCGYWPAA
jgi:tetratricopeptide repeat protein 8